MQLVAIIVHDEFRDWRVPVFGALSSRVVMLRVLSVILLTKKTVFTYIEVARSHCRDLNRLLGMALVLFNHCSCLPFGR